MLCVSTVDKLESSCHLSLLRHILKWNQEMKGGVRMSRDISCPGGIIYTIKAGDTFYSLARTYRIDVYAIMKANPNVDPNSLRIGQQICIPAVSPISCPGGIMYTIKAGDTFYSLARTHRIDVYAITKANPNVDPNRLRIGQQICIPSVR